MMSIEDAERLRGEALPGVTTNGRTLHKIDKAVALAERVQRPELACNISSTAKLFGRSRSTIRSWLEEAGSKWGAEHDPSRLLVNMAGAILRAPLTVDEKAAALSWAAVQFMRARKNAINRGG
jgi:hypothetical protein